jgi:hypothetical protein
MCWTRSAITVPNARRTRRRLPRSGHVRRIRSGVLTADDVRESRGRAKPPALSPAVKRPRRLTPQIPNRPSAYVVDRRPDPTPIHIYV